jgi:SET domain-containing protein
MAFKMKGTPYPKEKYSVKKSNIQGRGVFASKNFKTGELVGMAVTDEEAVTDVVNFRDARTELGKYLNHQNKENATLKSENNTLNIYTKSPIKKGEEITVNYQKGPNYIDGDLEGFKENK